MIDWLIANKEWIFSGVGVVIIVSILGLIFKRKKNTPIEQYKISGKNSINIQKARDVNFSSNYLETRQIALDVFEANFLRLANKAAEITNKRVEEFTDKLLTVLKENAPEALETFNEPDMQYTLFLAQKEYARTGDHDQAELLVNILIDRAKETERTLRQIVLNEAISIAPKLTSSQYDILSLLFVVKNVVVEMDTLDQLIDDIEFKILLVSGIKRGRGSILHLQYTGCCVVETSKSIIEILRETYPGLFQKGFARQEFYSIFNSVDKGKQFGDEILVKCLHNPELWQPKPKILEPTEQRFTELINEMGIDGDTASRMQKFLSSHVMSLKEINVYLHQTIPEFHRLQNMWIFDNLKQLKLTSVGIAIAQANLRSRFDFRFDLADWLS